MTRWLRRRKSDRRERRRRERREEREAEEAQRQQALSTQIPMVYQVLIILYDPVIFFVLLLINFQGNDAPWPGGRPWRQACNGS